MSDKPDTTPMSGAQFQRHVGTNPERWAEMFLAAYAKAEGLHTDADRLAFVMGWMRDAMDAAERDGSLQMLASFNVKQREIEPLTPKENTTLRETLAGLRIALTAQESGDVEHVAQCLRLQIKQLQFAVNEAVRAETASLGRLVPRQPTE